MKTPRKTKKTSPVKKWFLYFFVSFLIFTVAFTGLQLLSSQVGEISIFSPGESDDEFALVSIVDSDNPFFDTFKDSKRINVLILGLNPPLTDTIMLASFDTEQKHVDLISIPRDTYYPREGYTKQGQKKINAAYLQKPVNSAIAVSDLLMGMPIHYYALAEFKGIEKIVDAMKGVPVNVPFHMRHIDNTKGQEHNINIPAGEQVLMGKDAVDYLRFRTSNVKGYKSYATADLEREKAQQEFLKSAFQQSIGHMPSVVTSVHKNVQSNVDLKTALKITAKAVGMSKDDIATYSLPGKAGTGDDGLSYYFADEEQIKVMIEQIYLPPAPEEGTTKGAVGE